MITLVNFYTLYYVFRYSACGVGTSGQNSWTVLTAHCTETTNTRRQPDGGAGNRVTNKTLDFKSTELTPSLLVSFYCNDWTNAASQLLVVYLGLNTDQDF